MFITTADPILESPIITVNTMLSLLSVEYSTTRLACYVSDDAGSPITYYAVKEGTEFARLWVPFCKKYNVQVRAPFVYFSSDLQPAMTSSTEFVQDWKHMKREYLEMSRRIEGATKNTVSYQMNEEFVEFNATERGNHPSIIKITSENKGEDDIPHVIYVAREKRTGHPHHYKAGALNALARVSGVMTNAPFHLNVDCDMFANNPYVIQHAMCLLLGFDDEKYSGFVQAPHQYYGTLKDDPFGNEMVFYQRKMGRGGNGLECVPNAGTGSFHRRKITYGMSPDKYTDKYANLRYKELQEVFGNSKELIESIEKIISRNVIELPSKSDLCKNIPAATYVSTCTYEFRTSWGEEIAWLYGSVTEDVLTGSDIHARGWGSVYLWLDPPAFQGTLPIGGPEVLTQFRRYATGLFEVITAGNKNQMLTTAYTRTRIRKRFCYMWIFMWAVNSLVEFCYVLLPPYCFIVNSSFLPKTSNKEFILPFAILVVYNTSNIIDYLECGLTIRTWWNNQRMNRIISATSFPFGLLNVILKTLGLTETTFDVTKKDHQNNSTKKTCVDEGRFTFDSSPMFVLGTACVLVHIASLAIGSMTLLRETRHFFGLGEVVGSIWMILSFWPFVRGLYSKGNYGIPWSASWKAAGLASVFLQLCWLRKIDQGIEG